MPTKKCPFCAEEIQEEAIKCKHCGEFLTDKTKTEQEKWYFKTYTIVLAFLCIGPLALPLVFLNPKYSLQKKIAATVIIVILSAILIALSVNSLKILNKYYQQLFELMPAG